MSHTLTPDQQTTVEYAVVDAAAMLGVLSSRNPDDSAQRVDGRLDTEIVAQLALSRLRQALRVLDPVEFAERWTEDGLWADDEMNREHSHLTRRVRELRAHAKHLEAQLDRPAPWASWEQRQATVPQEPAPRTRDELQASLESARGYVARLEAELAAFDSQGDD